MTGSVRGALSNERPYRDRAPADIPHMQHLARRGHVFGFPRGQNLSPAPNGHRHRCCVRRTGLSEGPGSKPRKRPDWKRTNSRRSVPILGMTSLRANLRAEGRASRCSTSSAVFGWRLTVTCESRLRSLPPLPRADRNRRAARDRVFRCASCRQHCAPAAKVFCDTGAQPRSAAAPAQMPG